MSLQDKYKVLIDTANSSGIDGLQVAELDGVLQIRGTAPNADVKNKLWDVYNQIDPNFLTGDVVMNVDVSTAVTGQQVRVITESSNLNIRKGPGTDQPIVGKAAKDEIITLISRANDQWWLVRTKDNEEGYCYAQYLEPVS
ncbi:SH3 domain-containing protein [Sphingobacterium sp. DK4209]|uniref:SH3 domain-containing protein n=1 Tax=Sphingobacterium zhuxiongii TaxID=2662364 RepID=A0A5Q0Q8C4_9SPHI|nr:MULTISPECIES: SH3 domain-containing protein [unclassified Sphingobacterium]MVZ66852.1 SH3 domain-containing protein [Sphingobacterium sp. DK4209]QGA26225.1 SH3 domain-containing protein [Sphingobacterium sp. dk4302]